MLVVIRGDLPLSLQMKKHNVTRDELPPVFDKMSPNDQQHMIHVYAMLLLLLLCVVSIFIAPQDR